MPDRVTLHIGMHKTGTTAIQEALAGYDDGRTRMARLRHANHSIHMLTCFAADPTRYHVWVRQGMPPDKVLAIREAMRHELQEELSLKRRNLVISGEEMSLMQTRSVVALADCLNPHAKEVQVLAWLRPAASYVGSAFQQMVRAGQATLELPRPRYRERFEKFAFTFGAGAMVFRLYDPAAQKTRSAVTEFCDHLGILPQMVQDRQDNVALAPDALRLLWTLNREGPATTGSPIRLGARSATIRHLARRFSGRFSLPADMVAGGIDAADIGWAEGRTGLALMDCPTGGDVAAADRRLLDWMSTVTGPMLAVLDQDMDELGIRLTEKPTIAARMRALHGHFLAQAEAEAELRAATSAIFRARNRATRRPAGLDSSAS